MGFPDKFLENLELVDDIFAIDTSKRALECAAKNCDTSKVEFVWEDVQQWRSPKPLDFVVMNPPFHSNGKVDIELGEGFIISAAKNLLRMVSYTWFQIGIFPTKKYCVDILVLGKKSGEMVGSK